MTHVEAISALVEQYVTDQVAAVQSVADDFQGQLSEADAQVVALQSQLEAQGGTDTATIAGLRQQLADCQASHTPPSTARFYGDPGPGRLFVGGAQDLPDLTAAGIEAKIGTTLGIIRTYWQPDAGGVNGLIAAATDAVAHGRIPWVSTKVPGTWGQMASGAQDAWLQAFVPRIAAIPGPVWFCLHHEPLNDGMPDADWAKMYKHAAPILKQAPNLVLAPIQAGWAFDANNLNTSTAAQDVWRVPEADVMGVDSYNQWWVYSKSGAKNRSGATEGYKKWRSLEDIYSGFFAAIERWGDCPPAIAEYGAHYPWKEPGKAAAWMAAAYDHALAKGCVGLTWFSSGKNSPRGSWRFDSYNKPDETGWVDYHDESERITEWAREHNLPTSAHLSDLTL